MSQKNDTAVLALSLLITLGLGGGGLWLLKDQIFAQKQGNTNQALPSQKQPDRDLTPISNQSITDRISVGDKLLTPADEATPAKKEGVQALANNNYEKAIANLQAALTVKRNDPEALIFLNNARIGSAKSYTIGVSVPIGSDPNTALEILRGVAQAQNEINGSGGIQGVALKIAIANDNNNPEIAQQIATNLVNNQQVLGVVGLATSDVTLAAGNVYNSGQLVAITPTSTSVKITNFSRYVFRTVPSDFMAARTLANYMVKTLHKKNAAVFFNSQSNYSQSLKSEFVSAVSLEGGQVSSEFDLSKADFSASNSLKQATTQGVEVLMLASSPETLDKALQVVQVNQKKLTLLAGDNVYSLKTLEIGGEQAAGMIVAVPWHIDSDPKSDFLQKSQQLWGADVNWRTALAYDATRALIAALERNPTRAGVQQVLSNSEFNTSGASGIIRFLPSGDRNSPVQLVNIVPGSRSRTGYDFVPIATSTVKVKN